MGACGCKQADIESNQITITKKDEEAQIAGGSYKHPESKHLDIAVRTHESNAEKRDPIHKVHAKEADEELRSFNDKDSTGRAFFSSSNPNSNNTQAIKSSNAQNANEQSHSIQHSSSIKKIEAEKVTTIEATKKESKYYEPDPSQPEKTVRPASNKENKKKEQQYKAADKGDDSFGYEYDEPDEYGGGEDEAEIEIENAYYEADDKKNSSPKDAMEGFQTVIMLEENRDEKKYTFQSLLSIILIKCRLQLYEDLSGDVTKILKAMDKASKNEANDAINSILEALLNLEDQIQADKAIVKILDYLKEKNYEQLWLNASIRLCKIYLDRREYNQFQNLIESIKDSCKLPDGSDDMKKSSVLLEVYSLEINVHMQTMNIAKIKEIYNKTKNISSAIADPRTMGIIKDTHGKMLMIEKEWESARLELFEAFKYYQEVGNSRAKNMLKYVVCVSILAQSPLNPFDNVEAKVYREDSEIKLMDNLRTAYEQKNGKELIRIMGSQKHKIFDESFIQRFEEDLMNVICLEMIVALAAPYKRMKFEYLQRELNLSEKQVETYVSRLILDKKLTGKIDLVDGYFENNDAKKNEIEEKKNEALFHWIKSISSVNVY